MKKLFLAIAVILSTGAFEQRAAITFAQKEKATIKSVKAQMDSLTVKTRELNHMNRKIIKSYEK